MKCLIWVALAKLVRDSKIVHLECLDSRYPNPIDFSQHRVAQFIRKKWMITANKFMILKIFVASLMIV